MSTHKRQHHRRMQHHRSGFTLVEMLVSVALVMLMMTLFATIFQMATGSASKQRIIAESDQRSRQLTTILRADFSKRSFRNSFPFLPNESPSLTKVPFASRTGYLYISCNDPASFQDDIVQFTVDARQVQTSPDDSRYFGAAKLLFDNIHSVDVHGANGIVDLNRNPSLPYSPNQPDADDGDLSPNSTASSDAAEISLFLRGGNLIRRIMLIRDPLPVAGQDLETQPKSMDSNPPTPSINLNPFFQQSITGGQFFLGIDPTVPQDDFWRYFDFSAVPANWIDFRNQLTNVPTGVAFLGIDALSNENQSFVPSFGMPHLRFGFNPRSGLSREHESFAAGGRFVGRYLQAETSYPDFNWPNSSASIGNPMDAVNAVSLQANTGLVGAFQGGANGRGGDRRVEDVLMSNVREFRIELWDSRLERWVVPGHSDRRRYVNGATAYDVLGDYHILRNMQFDPPPNANAITYGPLQRPGVLAGVPHVFDTWHPRIALVVANGNLTTEIAETQPPYMPLKFYPPRQDGSTTRSGSIQVGPSPVSSRFPDIRAEYDPVAGRGDVNQGYWEPSTQYQFGDVVFADKDSTPGWNDDALPAFDWTLDSAGIPQQSVHIAYRCVGTTTGAATGMSSATSPPAWQSPGLRSADNDLLWEGFQNYEPLKSIRITISFIEPNSETPKQLSLVLPVTDGAR